MMKMRFHMWLELVTSSILTQRCCQSSTLWKDKKQSGLKGGGVDNLLIDPNVYSEAV